MVHKRESLKAEKRQMLGKKVKQLRDKGLIPASVYGRGMASVSVQMGQKETEMVYKIAGETALVDLTIDGGEVWPILFKNPQYDPVEEKLLHIDLHKVNLKEKISAEVPVLLVGESFAVKSGNVLMEIFMTIEVEALPMDLPENFTIDISKLEKVDDAITVADLEVDKTKVEIKTDLEQIIVKIAEPKEEVIEEVPTVAPSEVEATKQKTPEEESAETGDKEKATTEKKLAEGKKE